MNVEAVKKIGNVNCSTDPNSEALYENCVKRVFFEHVSATPSWCMIPSWVDEAERFGGKAGACQNQSGDFTGLKRSCLKSCQMINPSCFRHTFGQHCFAE